MNNWFTVKIKYIKQLEDGRLKSVTEPYLVDAASFTEAEARIYEEVGERVRGEFQIKGITKTEYADIFYYEDSEEWHKCKLTYVSVDADSGKEKKITSNFLVTAASVHQAYERIKESLNDMTVTFEIPAITLTQIVDVLPYNPDLDVELERRPMEESDRPVQETETEEEQENTEKSGSHDALAEESPEEESTKEEDTEGSEEEENDVSFEDETDK